MTTLLFLDDLLVRSRPDTVRRLGKPSWVPEGTLDEILCEGTWNRPTVYRSDEFGDYRALYNGVTVRDGVRIPLGLMLAHSSDGIHWSKPDLSDQTEVPDRLLPNQVYPMHYGGPAYFDPLDPDPSRRLKLLHSTGAVAPSRVGLHFSASPNGVQWDRVGSWGDRPLDAPISIFHNRGRGTYVVSHRPIKHDRRISFLETEDFLEFGEPQVVLSPDPEDSPLAEFYGMTVFPYEDLYIGLLLVMHVQASELHKRTGYVECQLAYSYDGWHFNRLFHRSFISRNARGEPGGGGIYPSSLLVDGDASMMIHSGGSKAGHFQTSAPLDSALILHSLRRDGWAYLEPSGLIGMVTTRPLRFSGETLHLNVRAPHGRVRVQLADLEGVPLAGFTFDDCEPYSGDDVRYSPAWRHGADASLAGRDVHVEIELTNAEIYAVRGDFEVLIGYGRWPA